MRTLDHLQTFDLASPIVLGDRGFVSAFASDSDDRIVETQERDRQILYKVQGMFP